MTSDATDRLQELLLREGLATAAQLERAERDSAATGQHYLQTLISHGLVSEETLAEAIAMKLSAPLVDLKRGSLDPEALKLLSPASARRHLMVPVACGPDGWVRVAFANPFDSVGREVAAQETGLQVEPMVATLSGVELALSRASAEVKNALPTESTRRVEERSLGAKEQREATSPAHRMAQGASMEQRHEALLLALVEAGVIALDDYLEILSRLVRR